MTTFSEKQSRQNSYKTSRPEGIQKSMIAMHKGQLSLHIKSPQKQQLTTWKIKNARKEDLQGSWRYAQVHGEVQDKLQKQNQKQRKTKLAVHDVSKSYVNTTGHKYVPKTE